VVTTYEPTFEQIRMTTQQRHKPSLGQVRATSIAGNDITSSCFYTLGLCGVWFPLLPLFFCLLSLEVLLTFDFIQTIAGIYSPISIAMVSILLFFFRAIYSEVGTALPLNGT
jgi:hypothetical protein